MSNTPTIIRTRFSRPVINSIWVSRLLDLGHLCDYPQTFCTWLRETYSVAETTPNQNIAKDFSSSQLPNIWGKPPLWNLTYKHGNPNRLIFFFENCIHLMDMSKDIHWSVKVYFYSECCRIHLLAHAENRELLSILNWIFPSFSLPAMLCDPTDLIWSKWTRFEAMTAR